MKKQNSFARCVALVLLAAVSLSGCGKTPPEQPGPPEPPPVVKPTFEVSGDALSFVAEAPAPQEVVVAAEEVEWSAEVENGPVDWLSVEKLEGKISVSVTTNETLDRRTGAVVVIPEGDGFDAVRIAVSQAGKSQDPPPPPPPPAPEFPDEVEFNMVYSAEYHGDKFGKGSGNFTLTFMNIVSTQGAIFESFTLEGFMPQVADPGEGYVPLTAGDYTWELAEEFTGAEFTFLSHYGAVLNAGTFYTSTLYGIDKQLFYPVTGGTVKVTGESYGNTKIVAEVVNAEGHEMKLTFTGPLMLENTTVEKEVAFNTTFTECYSAVDRGQYFEQPIRVVELGFRKTSTVDADTVSERLTLQFNMDIEAADGGIPTGRYFPHTTIKYAPRAPYTYMRGGSSAGITAGSIYTHQSQLYGIETQVFLDQDGGYIDVENHNDGTYTIAVRVLGTGYTNMLETIPNIAVNCDFTGTITIR